MSQPGTGGLPPQRPDQQAIPPPAAISPGATAGIFRGRQVVITGPGPGAGIFVYGGTPAPGNPPVLAITAPGTTTDPYGNAVAPVLLIGPEAGAHLLADDAGNLTLAGASGEPGIYLSPELELLAFYPAGTSAPPSITIANDSGEDPFTGFQFAAGIRNYHGFQFVGFADGAVLIGATSVGAPGSITTASLTQNGAIVIASGESAGGGVQATITLQDDDGGRPVQGCMANSQAPASTGALWEVVGTEADWGTWLSGAAVPDLPIAAPAGAEDWQPLILGAGWVNTGGAEVTAKYRYVSSPPNSIEIIGDLNPGTVTDGTTIATLPTAPAHTQPVSITIPAGTPTSPVNTRMAVNSAGNLQCEGMAGLTSASRIAFHEFISLDA